ncbi:MAG: EscS/YscS/HrcS family type III secretion system export apparatus protein [Verrucomicrobia bacterium]|nr:MAG: EscS/YscS/HrcS family type III secretion system export apparatus protein [Verrucomicrobiota bacterium]
MEDPHIIDLTVQGMVLVLILSMPAIVLATFSGLLVSLLQALTQIQEQTLGFAVKLIVVILTLLLTAHFMAGELFNYSLNLFKEFPVLGR